MKNKKQLLAVGNSLNALASGTIIKGDISAEEDMRIDGFVEGNIHCKGKVVISQNGEVRGQIVCSNIELAGKVYGDIHASGILVLKHTSFYQGDLQIQSLEIEPGAVFNGSCKMMNAADVKR